MGFCICVSILFCGIDTGIHEAIPEKGKEKKRKVSVEGVHTGHPGNKSHLHG